MRGVKSTIATGLVAASLLTAASAAMPLQYQRAKEFGAAIDAGARVLTVLDLIDRVEYSGEDKITVRAGRCVVLVDIVDRPMASGPGAVGARSFEARVNSRSCN